MFVREHTIVKIARVTIACIVFSATVPANGACTEQTAVPPTGARNEAGSAVKDAVNGVVKVETILLEKKAIPDIYEVIGTVRPKIGATVSARTMASILQIPVRPGDTVKAGAVLARLDDREERAAFERAEADYNRLGKLFKQGATTVTGLQSAEEQYRRTKAELSHATVTSPFDGIVAEKRCDVGDLAMPGKALFVIEQPEDFRLEAFVPERYAASVPIGTKVHVSVEAVGGSCEAIVGEVIPASDPASRSFLVKIDLHRRKPLKSGLFGRAQLVVGERSGLFVPASAIHERGQLTFVFIDEDSYAKMRLVRPGKPYGELVELLSGVSAGEKLIVGADGILTDGHPVQ
jgi:RND family efflux transporter MFP subunit